MWTIEFWREAAERAVKTFAQAVLALLAGDQFDLFNVDVADAAKVAMIAAVVSVLTSVASASFGPVGSPSLVEPSGLGPLAAASRGLVSAVRGSGETDATVQNRAETVASTLDDLGLGRRW